MADQQSNDTIRQMMSGFSAMQFNLGLLPMAQAQSMGGASQQFQAPPPPPQTPHPGEAAMQAMAQHNNMVQQTLQAAQTARYQPPPSAPTPAMTSMSAYGGGFGGGGYSGGGGGGFGGGGGYAQPIGGGGQDQGDEERKRKPYGAPVLPSIFNPFAATMPRAHFATPAQRNLQLMQHHQAQVMGTVAGIGEAAMGIGGSVLGGMVGGPIGAYVGGKIGGAISGMLFNPVTQDYARGRQVQQMTSPFMVSGAHLNTATGQGMDAQSARQVATGIRHLARDHDFERTGFNSQDAMRIMQTSASAGLLTGAQSPDQIVQKVKDISKTVKLLMKITGDPDVQHAIQSLGEMRSMGFQGLAAQSGALANRAQFARMAGVSQSTMAAIQAGGANMAGEFGLAGATGAMAAGFGAGSANVAASSGALNDLQLSRAGGTQGLGAIMTKGSLAAMQNEMYLLAGSKVGKGGKLEMDMDAFRKAQGMSFQEVSLTAANKLQEMQSHGIFDWNTRKQELKDTIAQKLKPGEQQMMMLQQARAFQAQVPGMTLGTALQKASGGALDENEGRALEATFTSRKYWEGLAQQTRAHRRDLADQEKASREQYRTPGLMTRMRQGVGDAFGAVSDTLSSPFRRVSGHFERVREEDEAAAHGESIRRYGDADIAATTEERDLLKQSIRGGGLRRSYARGGSNFVNETGTGGLTGALGRSAGRQMNRMGSFLGLSSESGANKLAAIADYSGGRYTSVGETFGDPEDALKRVQDVIEVSRAISAPALTEKQFSTMFKGINDVGSPGGKKFNAVDILSRASTKMLAGGGKAGRIKSARATSASEMEQNFIEAAMEGSNPMTQQQAERAWEGNKGSAMKRMSDTVYASGDQKAIERLEKSKDVEMRVGGVDLKGDRDAAKDQIADELKMSGMGDVSDKTMSEVKALVSQNKDDEGNEVLVRATAERALTSGNKEEKAKAAQFIKEFGDKYAKDPDKLAAIEAKALRVAGSMSKDAADAMERTFRGTPSLAGAVGAMGLVRIAAGHKMELAAHDEFASRIASQTGRKDLEGMDPDKAFRSLHPDDVEKLDSKTREAYEKWSKGDSSGLDEEIAKAGPTTKTVRHSGASSDALRKLDEDAARLDDQAAQAGEDQDPAAKLQEESTSLFAKSVSEFATAVKEMKGKSDAADLAAAHVEVQSIWGSR